MKVSLVFFQKEVLCLIGRIQGQSCTRAISPVNSIGYSFRKVGLLTMEKQSSSKSKPMEKHPSFRGIEMEKQKSFRGLMEKQKSFRIVMERQLSFLGGGGSGSVDKRKSKESPGKRGDSPLHLAARAGNSSKVREILQNCGDPKAPLAKLNLEGETPLYTAAENGHVGAVIEILKHSDLESASIAARNGLDPFHVAAKHGHLGEDRSCLISCLEVERIAGSDSELKI